MQFSGSKSDVSRMICTYHNVTEFVSLLLHLNYSGIIWENVISATLLTVDSSEWKLCSKMFT